MDFGGTLNVFELHFVLQNSLWMNNLVPSYSL